MPKHDWIRWQGCRGLVNWTLGFACYHIYGLLPWVLAKRANVLLPRVGDYIYWDDAIAVMKQDLST